MVKVRKIRLVNPTRQRTRKRNVTRRKRRTNPLATLGYLNPQKGTHMKKYSRKRRRSNPFGSKRRRRNPSIPAVANRGIDIVKTGGAALVGMMASRQLPHMVLGARNQGLIGYLANAAATAVTSALIAKYVDKNAGRAAAVGGSLYLVQRVLDEQTPLGQRLRSFGLGDARAASFHSMLSPGGMRGIGPSPAVQTTSCPASVPPAAAAAPRLAGRF